MNKDTLEKSPTFSEIVGIIIKNYRLKKNLTIEQLANNCSISIEILQKIESAEVDAYDEFKIINKICKYMGTNYMKLHDIYVFYHIAREITESHPSDQNMKKFHRKIKAKQNNVVCFPICDKTKEGM